VVSAVLHDVMQDRAKFDKKGFVLNDDGTKSKAIHQW
jgi:hypothetical protein